VTGTRNPTQTRIQSPRRLAGTVVFIVGLALFAAAVVASVRPFGADARPSASGSRVAVAVVGDSLIFQAETGMIYADSTAAPGGDFTDDLLGSGYDATVVGLPGEPFSGVHASAALQARHGADIVVVAAGTNDVRLADEQDDPGALDRSTAELGRVLDDLDATPCVLVLTFATTSPLHRLDQLGPELNGSIRATAAEHDNVHVADWEMVAAANPEWFNSVDSVHLTPDGAEAYRDFILSSLSACADDAAAGARPATAD